MKVTGHKFSVHCAYAACANGNLRLLEWLDANGCPLSSECYKFAVVCRSPRMSPMITTSSLLALVGARFCIVSLDKTRMDGRNVRDNTHILNWLHQRKVQFCINQVFLSLCLCKNNTYGIDWFFQHYKLGKDDSLSMTGAYAMAGVYAIFEAVEHSKRYLKNNNHTI
jgi:hypothetical protein